MMRFLVVVRLLLTVVLLGTVARVAAGQDPQAQVGGRVSGTEGEPIAGAQITVVAEDGWRRETVSGSDGRFRITVAGSGDRFVVSVTALGRAPAVRVVPRGQSSALAFVLPVRAMRLDPLRVSGRRSKASDPRRTPGTQRESLDALVLRREAAIADDIAALAGQQAGVSSLPGSEGAGVSVAGQAPEQTRITVDGAGTLAGELPREAIRSLRVETSAYDASRGQSTGSQVAITTQRAGALWGGAIRASGQAPPLVYGDLPGSLGRQAARSAIDVAAGGPVLPGRVSIFGAATLRGTTEADRSLFRLDDRDLRRLHLNPDTVQRLLGALDALGYAAPRGARGVGGAAVGLLRLDAELSRVHSLMVRMDGRLSSSSGHGGEPFSTHGAHVTRDDREAGAVLELVSGGAQLGNTFRVRGARTTTRRGAEVVGASGSVDVGGTSHDLARLTTLRFGSYDSPGSRVEQGLLEMTDEIARVSADGRHRIRIGAGWSTRRFGRSLLSQDAGAFSFRSIADLENSAPSSFSRILGGGEQLARVHHASSYLADHWKNGRVQLDVGVRLDRTLFRGAGASSQPQLSEVVQGAGLHQHPRSATHLSPRAGFSMRLRMPWEPAAGGSTTVQGGFGRFVGTVPLASLASALGTSRVIDLLCIGEAAPQPDWRGYANGTKAIPTACADGGEALPMQPRGGTLFSPSFGPPLVDRASVDANGPLGGPVQWRASVLLLRGSRQPLARDLNLRSDGGSTLPQEGERGFFAPLATVDPATGLVPMGGSRRDPGFGIVREISGAGRARTARASAGVSMLGQGRRGAVSTLDLDYTWTRSLQSVSALSAPGAAWPSTGSDPFSSSWGTAPFEQRHLLQATLRHQGAGRRLTMTARGRLASRLPFTPLVQGDVNGDGASNDRAFIFDPAATADPAVAVGLRELIADAPSPVRRCLKRQLGRIAGVNSCRGGWDPYLDLFAELRLGRLSGRSVNRTTLWIAARDVGAGLDHLLHGGDELRGWSQQAAPDPVLLRVRGFDPNTRSFRYQVNPDFGRVGAASLLHRTPMTLSIQARVVIGKDPSWRSLLQQPLAGGAQPSPDDTRRYLSGRLRNVPAEVLALIGPRKLWLSPSQVDRLQAASDSIEALRLPLVDSLAALALLPAGARVHAEAAALDEARRLLRRGTDVVRTTVSPDQWRRLPRAVRKPDLSFAPVPPREFAVGGDGG